MKSKKLLISLAVVAVVVVIVVVLATVFTVQDVIVVYHNVYGGISTAPSNDGIASDDVKAIYKGKSIVLLSKDDLMAKLNELYPQWHAFAVVKEFQNKVVVHIVRSTAIVKFKTADGQYVYIDYFGYATQPTVESEVIDISSAFESKDVSQNTVGAPFKFESEESNARLSYVLETILATWRCYVDIPDLPEVLGNENVFSFDADGNMVIHMKLGGYIVVQSPDTELGERIIKAYGVYYNETINLQGDDWVITVHKNGSITTPSK